MKKIIAVLIVITLMLTLCACTEPTGDVSSTAQVETIIIDDKNDEENNITSAPSSDIQSTSSTQDAPNNNNSVSNDSDVTSDNSSTESKPVVNPNASAQPDITLFTPVADNIYIIGGSCSNNTEYIQIGGAGVKAQKVVPAKGKDKSYFTAQVQLDYSTYVEIHAKEKGKDLSEEISKYITTKSGMKNQMTTSDYRPVFGLDSRMHFYSAILTYSKSNFLSGGEKEYAKDNMSATVAAAKSVGAEVIYLVVPSSAAVYPETVPSEYKAASGETLYKAFKSIAEQSGATVLYPLDDLKAHKNDGDGYKIYSHTDSHWTTYGAYFGVSSLMNKISSQYPSAKPRTVKEMGFYTTELYGGDALFSFDDYNGFENYSQAGFTSGKTSVTGIMELTTMYNLKMPTDTLTTITRGKKSIYLTKDNASYYEFTNKNGSGLPTAVITRDSFGRTAFDMVNDRFSKVTWLAENDFSNTIDAIKENKPNYVIYIVSERNLYKVMMNNANMALINKFK